MEADEPDLIAEWAGADVMGGVGYSVMIALAVAVVAALITLFTG